MAETKTVAVETKDDFASRIADSVAQAVAKATVQVQERIAPVESRHPSLVSPYNPEGLKNRPRLERRYIFCGGELDEKFLTNKEIEELNKITHPGEYHQNRWKVRVRRDDTGHDTVFIDLPVKSLDARMELPNSMLAILSEIQNEAKTKGLDT